MNRNLFSGLNISKNATYFPTIQLLHGKYQRKINRCGGIDLAILGVGTNGHIAFNEPGTPINSLTHIVRIKKSTREANARFFDNNIDNVPTQAVTCGLKSILSSKKIVLIATGASKKDAIEHVKNAKVYDPN
jgi:glucosamine-6-phosphate deaminase